MSLKEFCRRCQRVTASKVEHHPSGTEYLCAECGAQVDFLASIAESDRCPHCGDFDCFDFECLDDWEDFE